MTKTHQSLLKLGRDPSPPRMRSMLAGEMPVATLAMRGPESEITAITDLLWIENRIAIAIGP